jgi:hypothetical protein
MPVVELPALSLLALGGASCAVAQNTPSRIPPFEQIPTGEPNSFVTSQGLDACDHGGLAGADAPCARLAAAAFPPNRIWRVNFSTQLAPRPGGVLGEGPTGKPVFLMGMGHLRIAGAKIVEDCMLFDEIGTVAQTYR